MRKFSKAFCGPRNSGQVKSTRGFPAFLLTQNRSLCHEYVNSKQWQFFANPLLQKLLAPFLGPREAVKPGNSLPPLSQATLAAVGIRPEVLV